MRTILVLVFVAGLTACGSMSKQGRDTAIGAGLGTAAGAAVTNTGLGAVGGGLAGGIIGHEIGRK
jgi:osmotically inducible lipoprotein OsmB